MRKAIALLLAPILLGSYLSNIAVAAAPKTGATCSKLGSTTTSNGMKYTCVKSGKKFVWSTGVAVSVSNSNPTPTPSATPSPSASPTPTPTPTIKFYVAQDQNTLQSITSKDACSNPAKASFEIQALVNGSWLPVKLIDFGYKASTNCTDPALGQRNSLAFAKFYMDPGTTYRWLYSGEVNYAGDRDAQGRVASAEFKITVPLPPAPVPVTLPVAQTGKITFANAASNYSQIPQVAWQNVQDEIAANNSVNVPTTIHIGPNTNASLTAITTGLDRINKLFAGFNHVSSYTGIVYSAKDLQWSQIDAANFFQTLGIKGGFAQPEVILNQSSAGCEMNGQIAIECGGGMAWDLRQNNSDAGGSYYGVQSGNYWTDALKNSGPMTQVTHEATHNYQVVQFFHTPLGENQFTSSGLSHDFTPWWFSEGQANGIGIATFIDNLSDYLGTRNYTVVRSPGSNVTLPAFTAEGMKSFLMEYQPTGPQNKNWPLAYSIGYATVEALIAIGGPRATMALYALGSNGENWETAFKHVYGITWDEGATALGKVLAAQYAANPIRR